MKMNDQGSHFVWKKSKLEQNRKFDYPQPVSSGFALQIVPFDQPQLSTSGELSGIGFG
jgi:hypothetical protein